MDYKHLKMAVDSIVNGLSHKLEEPILCVVKESQKTVVNDWPESLDCEPSYFYLGENAMSMKTTNLKIALDIIYDLLKKAHNEELSDWPESEEFYNLMQAYRHAPMEDQKAVVDAYEAVKEYLRGLY